MSRVARLCIAAVLLAVLSGAALLPAARADGDPASDYLLGQDVFLPYSTKVSSSEAKQLTALVNEAARERFTIKVAVIAERLDLGADPSLFLKPQVYAEFLGKEILFIYRGRLLVVMPNGFGVSVGGRPAPSLAKVLAALPSPGAGTGKLVAGAETGVQRLAANAGHRLTMPKSTSTGGQTAADRIKIGAAVVGVLALLGASMLVRRGRRSRPQER
jgi:hypothetical protein